MGPALSAASTHRQEALSYITAKTAALRDLVNQLEEIDSRARAVTTVLNALWDDLEFVSLLLRTSAEPAPTSLRDASGLAARVQDLRCVCTDQGHSDAEANYPGELDRAARALLSGRQAPDRAYAFLDKLRPPRQWAVAKLMVAVEDYSQRFIAALLGGTPEADRVLVNRLGGRSVALQEQLAQQEQALIALHRRKSDLTQHCTVRGFQLALANGCIRSLLADASIRGWLFARRPHEAAKLVQWTETGTGVLGEGDQHIPGCSLRY